MKAPPIYIAIKGWGDGYGHSSRTYLSWHFTEKEARAAAEAACAGVAYHFAEIEEVPAADPIEEERW